MVSTLIRRAAGVLPSACVVDGSTPKLLPGLIPFRSDTLQARFFELTFFHEFAARPPGTSNHQPARSVHQADTRASDRLWASGYRAYTRRGCRAHMDVLFAIRGDDVVHMPFMKDVVHDVGTRRTDSAFCKRLGLATCLCKAYPAASGDVDFPGRHGGLNDATDEAGSEAKAPQGSRTGVGSRWRVFVASGRRIRSNRTGSGCTVVEHRTRSRNHAQ